MKKFTELSNNKKEEEVCESTRTIENIIESSLSILVDGEIDDYLALNINIDGKEELINKLSLYINEMSYKNTAAILERIKYQGLDKVLLEHQSLENDQKYTNIIENILTTTDPIEKAIRLSGNTGNGEDAYRISIVAENLISNYPNKGNILRKIRDVYSIRANQLGITHG